MMDTGKISNGATKILAFLSAPDTGLAPEEKMAALKSAAAIIQETIQAELFKATMASVLRNIMGPTGSAN